MTPYQNELLTILIEECGETTQEICKIKRFGLHEESHHIPGSSHLTCLENELGDLMAVIELLVDSDVGISKNNIDIAIARKKEKLKLWMKHTK